MQVCFTMRDFLRVVAGAILSVSFAVLPALAGEECIVDDPTGTPLNVRAAPNGAILTVLYNGTRIEIVEETKLGRKRWLFVSRQGERLGWVFGSYVVCPKDGDAREIAPSQPVKQR